MERYKNLGGDSGVVGYDIGSDFIRVEFSDGSVYRYTYASAGSHKIERMKQLAESGQGLNSFINTDVRKAYAEKNVNSLLQERKFHETIQRSLDSTPISISRK